MRSSRFESRGGQEPEECGVQPPRGGRWVVASLVWTRYPLLIPRGEGGAALGGAGERRGWGVFVHLSKFASDACVSGGKSELKQIESD